MIQFEHFVGHLTEALSGRQWSPAETQQQVHQRAQTYIEKGIEPGDRVLILFGNNLEFFAELLALWKLGACVIPVDVRLTAFEVEKLVETALPRFSVFLDDPDSAILDAVSGTTVRQTTAIASSADKHSDQPDHSFPRLDDDALILFTSGSTGQPKGVVHTHRSLLARWSGLRQSIGLKRYRRTLCLLPTHFGHGLICNCLFPWLSGCDLVIAPPFKPELVMRLGAMIDRHEITFMSSVPSVWNLALRTAKSPENDSLERVHIGSAPLSENLWTRVQRWARCDEVFNTYGITETGSWVAGTTGGEVVPESGLIGEGWGAQIRIMSLQSEAAGNEANPDFISEHECAAGDPGMVWLHTPALMKGYFQRPDLTAAAIRHGWFKTGDIGLLDDRGRLYLKGRERDEINKGGMKVFPADIDEVVEQYPQVQDVCSFGYRDDFYGENVAMAVVLSQSNEQVWAGLHQWVRQHLAEHKHPVRWYVLEDIPRTSRGKINRETVGKACESLQPLDLRSVLARTEKS